MAKFRLNKHRLNPNKTHEVHKDSCTYFNQLTHFEELGEFVFCSTAIQMARNLGYEHLDGCKICCEECHREVH